MLGHLKTCIATLEAVLPAAAAEANTQMAAFKSMSEYDKVAKALTLAHTLQCASELLSLEVEMIAVAKLLCEGPSLDLLSAAWSAVRALERLVPLAQQTGAAGGRRAGAGAGQVMAPEELTILRLLEASARAVPAPGSYDWQEIDSWKNKCTERFSSVSERLRDGHADKPLCECPYCQTHFKATRTSAESAFGHCAECSLCAPHEVTAVFFHLVLGDASASELRRRMEEERMQAYSMDTATASKAERAAAAAALDACRAFFRSWSERLSPPEGNARKALQVKNLLRPERVLGTLALFETLIMAVLQQTPTPEQDIPPGYQRENDDFTVHEMKERLLTGAKGGGGRAAECPTPADGRWVWSPAPTQPVP